MAGASRAAARQTKGAEQPSGPARKGRIRGFDAIRGFSVVSMVAFHLCYDLVYLEGVPLGWFAPPFQDIWRASISWTFLVVAGIMCSHSRSNLRRGARYLGVALAIYVVTAAAAVDTPISFGIIYCMGASTLVAWALERLHLLPRSVRGLAVLALALVAAFVLCLGVPTGTVGLGALGGPTLPVPRAPYASGVLSWLGFPGPGFASGDYYTPVPFTLLFLAGTCLGRIWSQTKTPAWLAALRCRPLEWVGRHALEVYVIHQPVLLLVTGLP